RGGGRGGRGRDRGCGGWGCGWGRRVRGLEAVQALLDAGELRGQRIQPGFVVACSGGRGSHHGDECTEVRRNMSRVMGGGCTSSPRRVFRSSSLSRSV